MYREVSCVVFDLGRVLVNFDHMRGCRQVSTVTGIPESTLWKVFFEDQLEFDFEAGKVTAQEVINQLRQMSTKTFADDEIWLAAGDIFEEIPGMHALVRDVKAAVPKVGLLSNTSEIHWRHVQQNFAVAKEFEHIALSYELRTMKPQTAIYEKTAQLMRTDPKTTIFIDDIEANVLGARAAGWQAIVFENCDQLRRELNVLGVGI